MVQNSVILPQKHEWAIKRNGKLDSPHHFKHPCLMGLIGEGSDVFIQYI
jgi:hypothetical protein